MSAHPFDGLDPAALRDPASRKWRRAADGALPLWIADMDFPVAPAILDALHARLARPLGYLHDRTDARLVELLIEAAAARGWTGLAPRDFWTIQGVVPGLHTAVLALADRGDEVITQTPIYPPFLDAIRDHGRALRENPMRFGPAGWALDFGHLETLATPATRLLLLSHPHNPTGRAFSREELEALADFALRHRLYVVSDEVHADLVLDGTPHVPFASLSPEVAARTVTLLGPGKAFNVAGLGVAVAVSQNPALLARLQGAVRGLVGETNVLAVEAWRAGLETGGAWLDDVRAYLCGNRDFLTRFLASRLPRVGYAPPQATYLAWLDFGAYPFAPYVHEFLEEEARVVLNDGLTFGSRYAGYARLNFATSRPILAEALERVARTIERRAKAT